MEEVTAYFKVLFLNLMGQKEYETNSLNQLTCLWAEIEIQGLQNTNDEY
jgi:hypothetical protein